MFSPASRRLPLVVCLLCVLCFLHLPAAPSPPPPSLVRFAVIGDSGTGDEYQFRIALQMLAWHDRLPFSLVLMLGDNIYGGLWGGGDKKYFGDKFDRPYAKLLTRQVTFRAALGNHDMYNREGGDLIEDFNRFHIGGPQGYYSFTAGEWLPGAGAPGLGAKREDPAPLIEFFVINTVRLEKGKKDPEQLAWLERALAASRARWRILYGHHPLYSTGKRHGGDPKLRDKLAPLLEGRVHIVLAGHDHIYQRFRPQQGIAHFVCGSSGKLRRGNARPDPEVAAVEDRQHVFMLWDATPEELRYRAINEQGVAFDCGVLRPAAPPEPVSCAALAALASR